MNLWDWKRTTKHCWTRDARWQAVHEMSGKWRAYRDGEPMLGDFPTMELAAAEAERLREADELYAAKAEVE